MSILKGSFFSYNMDFQLSLNKIKFVPDLDHFLQKIKTSNNSIIRFIILFRIGLYLKYFWGDIHGQYDDLQRILEKIGIYEKDFDSTVVFLGDYVDRGSHVRTVSWFMRNLHGCWGNWCYGAPTVSENYSSKESILASGEPRVLCYEWHKRLSFRVPPKNWWC